MKKVSKYRILKRIIGLCHMEGCKGRGDFSMTLRLPDSGKKVGKRLHLCDECLHSLLWLLGKDGSDAV